MSDAKQSIEVIIKYSNLLTKLWLLNNIIGISSIVALIYFSWWVWDLGWWGILVTLIGAGLINSIILRIVFGAINKPIADKAGQRVRYLLSIGVIDSELHDQLVKVKVEHWGDILTKYINQTKIA